MLQPSKKERLPQSNFATRSCFACLDRSPRRAVKTLYSSWSRHACLLHTHTHVCVSICRHILTLFMYSYTHMYLY